MGGALCTSPSATSVIGSSSCNSAAGMARVLKVGKPSQSDPTGTGTIINDILTPWNFPDSDPFILLHEFGPMDGAPNIPIRMHPHRGFNEVPYLKQGDRVAIDAWRPNGDPSNPMTCGSVQWGSIGSGIEHGVKYNPTYKGPVHGFQMWVNLPSANKMDPPCFQDADPDAMPIVELSDKARAKVMAGEVAGQASPMDTGRVRVQYVDFMLDAGADINHVVPEGHTSVFVYVYAGQGKVCSQACKRGDVLRIEPSGPLSFIAESTNLGFLLLAGVPLREKIVQHGPFVMATQDQIQKTFRDYQSGKFLNETCKYVAHKTTGSVESSVKLR